MQSNSDTGTEELLAPDPLLHGLDLPLESSFYPCGCAVRVTTNSAGVLDAARESWPDCQPTSSDPPVELRVAVTEDASTTTLAPSVFRAQRNVLGIVADAANLAVCDLSGGFGACWLSSAAVRDRGYLRWYFLDPMAYCMLEHLYFVGLHAACVVFEGQAVLLPGSSGAGKSCLAYACARRGWTYLCDDWCFLRRRSREPVVLGLSHLIRFRDSAVRLFPELAGRPVFVRGEGKPSIELATTGLSTTTSARVHRLVFLDRQDTGPAGLVRLPAQDALHRLESQLYLCEDHVFQEKRAALRNLPGGDAHTLRYSDLNSAVAELERLVRTVG